MYKKNRKTLLQSNKNILYGPNFQNHRQVLDQARTRIKNLYKHS